MRVIVEPNLKILKARGIPIDELAARIKKKGRLKHKMTVEKGVITLEEDDVSFKKLYVLEDKISHLMVDGIGNIKRAIVRKEDGEFIIFTEGSDLKAILEVPARAAFEITSTHLLQAGLTGETDVLVGVAENIIVGQPVHLGTGAVSAIYKPKKKAKRRK